MQMSLLDLIILVIAAAIIITAAITGMYDRSIMMFAAMIFIVVWVKL